MQANLGANVNTDSPYDPSPQVTALAPGVGHAEQEDEDDDDVDFDLGGDGQTTTEYAQPVKAETQSFSTPMGKAPSSNKEDG
jgi:hypothetical protein